MNYKEQFIELLRTSTLMQAILTTVMLIVISYLVITGQQIPDLLTNSFLLILGYYFGTKSQQAIERTTDKIGEVLTKTKQL